MSISVKSRSIDSIFASAAALDSAKARAGHFGQPRQPSVFPVFFCCLVATSPTSALLLHIAIVLCCCASMFQHQTGHPFVSRLQRLRVPPSTCERPPQEGRNLGDVYERATILRLVDLLLPCCRILCFSSLPLHRLFDTKHERAAPKELLRENMS